MPELTPVTAPAVLTVATEGFELLHTPPTAPSTSVTYEPEQIEALEPTIEPELGVPRTVILLQALVLPQELVTV